MAVSFEVVNIGKDTATIRIKNPDKYYLRVYLRYADDEKFAVVDKWLDDTPENWDTIVTNLSPNTKYIANVAYSTVHGYITDGGWVGAQSFITKDDTELPTGKVILSLDAISIEYITARYQDENGWVPPKSASGKVRYKYYYSEDGTQTFTVLADSHFRIHRVGLNNEYDYPYTITVTNQITGKIEATYSGTEEYPDYDVSVKENQNYVIVIKSTNYKGDAPNKWYWESVVAKGEPINLTAYEWSNFQSRILAFRDYRNVTGETFTKTPKSGDVITADICNEAWNAINDIPQHGTMPVKAVKGRKMTAAFFNGLKDALNAAQ